MARNLKRITDPDTGMTYVVPVDEGAPTVVAQSNLGPVPRGEVHPKRRAIYPVRSEKTARYRRKLSPEEYIKKKTFERPGFFAIDRPLQTAPPYPNSLLVAAVAGTTTNGIIEVTAEADFEVVKIMAHARDATHAIITNYMVNLIESASGRFLMNQPIHGQDLAGTSQMPLILPVTLFVNRSSTIQVQVTNLGAAPAFSLYFTLLGIKYYYRDAMNLTGGEVQEDVEYKRL